MYDFVIKKVHVHYLISCWVSCSDGTCLGILKSICTPNFDELAQHKTELLLILVSENGHIGILLPVSILAYSSLCSHYFPSAYQISSKLVNQQRFSWCHIDFYHAACNLGLATRKISVCLSICLYVKCVICDKMKESCAHVLIPHESLS